MKSMARAALVASLSVSVITLSACGGGGTGTQSSSENEQPVPSSANSGEPAEQSSGSANVGGSESAAGSVLPSGYDTSVDYVTYLSNSDIFNSDIAVYELNTFQPTTGLRHRLNPELANGHRIIAFRVSGDRTKIAFTAQSQSGQMELFSAHPDGTSLTKLSEELDTGGNVNSFEIHWSPDSSKIAYLADTNNDGKQVLYVVDADGQKSQAFTGASAGSLLWSPDSTHVMYRQRINSQGLYVADVASGTTKRLSGNQSLSKAVGHEVAQWAPDSSRIVYFADAEEAEVFELFSIKPDGSDGVKLNAQLATGGQVFLSSINWSADSTRVVYAANQDSVEVIELYSVGSDGSNRIKLSEEIEIPIGAYAASEGVLPYSLQMAPDGSRVTYLTNRTRSDLYSVKLDGTGSTRLNNELQSSLMDVELNSNLWAADSSRLIYVSNEDVIAINHLYSVKPDGTDRVLLTPPTQLAQSVEIKSLGWSSDNSAISYVLNKSGSQTSTLHIATADAQTIQQISTGLPSNSTLDPDTISWSSDSKRVSFVAKDESIDQSELFSAGIDIPQTKLNNPLSTDGTVVATEVQWSADGNWIVYRADQDLNDVFELYTVRADGSEQFKANSPMQTGGRVESKFVWAP